MGTQYVRLGTCEGRDVVPMIISIPVRRYSIDDAVDACLESQNGDLLTNVVVESWLSWFIFGGMVGYAVRGDVWKLAGMGNVLDPGGDEHLLAEAIHIYVAADEVGPISPAARSFAVPFTIYNRSSDDIYIDRCGGGLSSMIEKLVDSEWVSIADPACILLPMPAMKVGAGKTVRDSAKILNVAAGSLTPGASYRLVLRLVGSDDDSEVLAKSWGTSNLFSIRIE